MLGVWLVIFVMFYLFGNKASGRTYFTFADCFVIGFWVTVAITLFFWVVFGSEGVSWFLAILTIKDGDKQVVITSGTHYPES